MTQFSTYRVIAKVDNCLSIVHEEKDHEVIESKDHTFISKSAYAKNVLF